MSNRSRNRRGLRPLPSGILPSGIPSGIPSSALRNRVDSLTVQSTSHPTQLSQSELHFPPSRQGSMMTNASQCDKNSHTGSSTYGNNSWKDLGSRSQSQSQSLQGGKGGVQGQANSRGHSATSQQSDSNWFVVPDGSSTTSDYVFLHSPSSDAKFNPCRTPSSDAKLNPSVSMGCRTPASRGSHYSQIGEDGNPAVAVAADDVASSHQEGQSMKYNSSAASSRQSRSPSPSPSLHSPSRHSEAHDDAMQCGDDGGHQPDSGKCGDLSDNG